MWTCDCLWAYGVRDMLSFGFMLSVSVCAFLCILCVFVMNLNVRISFITYCAVCTAVCPKGYWGEDCRTRCAQRCRYTAGCFRNGTCFPGCGWTGTKCNQGTPLHDHMYTLQSINPSLFQA